MTAMQRPTPIGLATRPECAVNRPLRVRIAKRKTRAAEVHEQPHDQLEHREVQPTVAGEQTTGDRRTAAVEEGSDAIHLEGC